MSVYYSVFKVLSKLTEYFAYLLHVLYLINYPENCLRSLTQFKTKHFKFSIFTLMFKIAVPERNTCWDYDQLPPGLSIIENFVDFTEETMLLDCVQWGNEDSTEGVLYNIILSITQVFL